MGKITTEGIATRRVAPDRMILTLCFFQRSAEVDRTVTDAHGQCERFLDALAGAGFPLKQVRLSGAEGRVHQSFPAGLLDGLLQIGQGLPAAPRRDVYAVHASSPRGQYAPAGG